MHMALHLHLTEYGANCIICLFLIFFLLTHFFQLLFFHCNHDPQMIGVNSSGNWPPSAPWRILAAHFNRDICAYILKCSASLSKRVLWDAREILEGYVHTHPR